MKIGRIIMGTEAFWMGSLSFRFIETNHVMSWTTEFISIFSKAGKIKFTKHEEQHNQSKRAKIAIKKLNEK